MLVDRSLLVGKTVRAIHTYAQTPVHPAWANEQTTPVAVARAFVEVGDGALVEVSPCEVDVPSGYPILGLSVTLSAPSALTYDVYGSTYRASPLSYVSEMLPFSVDRVDVADPLGEGAISEIRLSSQNGVIFFRHIMPPMTLGIEVERALRASNISLERR